MRVSLLAIVSLWMAEAGCRDNQAPAEAQALWDRFHAEDYRAWSRAPGYETRQSGEGPHSDDVEIFVNEAVRSALAAGTRLDAWPEGSLIVKDGFEDDGALEIVAAMEKRASGWFWAEYDASGKPLYSGSPDICTGCHDSGDDFVRAFRLPGR